VKSKNFEDAMCPEHIMKQNGWVKLVEVRPFMDTFTWRQFCDKQGLGYDSEYEVRNIA